MHKMLVLMDAALEHIVPKAVAAACCPSEPWCEEELDSGGQLCHRYCHYNCACTVFCGPLSKGGG